MEASSNQDFSSCKWREVRVKLFYTEEGILRSFFKHSHIEGLRWCHQNRRFLLSFSPLVFHVLISSFPNVVAIFPLRSSKAESKFGFTFFFCSLNLEGKVKSHLFQSRKSQARTWFGPAGVARRPVKTSLWSIDRTLCTAGPGLPSVLTLKGVQGLLWLVGPPKSHNSNVVSYNASIQAGPIAHFSGLLIRVQPTLIDTAW